MQIPGPNNWRLRIRREKDRVSILSAVTCDTRAALPDDLFGLPVSALEARALSPAHLPDGGEPVELVCGPSPAGSWDNRALEELTLPNTLEQVGDYALYGCRTLRALRLNDRAQRWGGGVFTGCNALRRFVIGCTGKEGALLRYLTRELSGELDITLRRDGADTARLLFPEYLELYEENCPAHLFDCKVYGAGLPYHHVLNGSKVELTAYDQLWREFLGREHDSLCALRLAWWRLRLPKGLSDGARADYLAYLRAHAAEAGRWLIGRRDGPGLAALLEWTDLDSETLSTLGETARQARFTEGQALLLEQRRRRSPSGFDRSFEL